VRLPWVIGFTLAGLAFAGDDPGQTAVRYLEQVRAGKVNLDPGKDTALSPITGEDKRAEIAKRLEQLKKGLGPEAFAAQEVKTDGDFAAALVIQDSPLDSSKLRVETVALLRQGNAWLPAPLPGSFENTSLGYDANRSRRQRELVDWMQTRQPAALDALRANAQERLRGLIREKISPGDLRTSSPRLLAQRFVKACRERDTSVLLGLLGGLSEPPFGGATETPVDLNRTFAGKTPAAEWRDFVSPQVIVSVLGETIEANRARVSLGLLDTTAGKTGAPRFAMSELLFRREADESWRLTWPGPPQDQLRGSESQNVFLSKMPDQLRMDFPPTPQATSAEIHRAFPAALLSSDPTAALPLVDLTGEPETTCNRLLAFASVRHGLPAPGSFLLVPVALKEEGDRAIAAYQTFRPQEAGRTDLRVFHFKKSATGWLWHPEGATSKAFATLNAFAEREKAGWETEWQRRLFESSALLDSPAPGEAPDETAAREVFARWQTALGQKGDPFAALATTTHLRLRDDDASHFLRNFGYEWIDAHRPDAAPAKVLGVVRHGRWAGISLRTDKSSDAAVYPLYPIVQTPAGPRLLLEIDLVAGGDRSREFLNEASLQRLGKIPDALAELRQLFTLHRQLADADRARTP